MHANEPRPLLLLLFPSFFSGDPNKADTKGCSPLHIAATYGNFDALQVLVAHRANLWALDNRGFHAAKVAALNQKLECCRYLDNIAIHLQTQHPDHVRSQQSKSLKDLEKRVKEAQKHGGNYKPRKYHYATTPIKRTSSDPDVRRKKTNPADAARQNFVLQRPGDEQGQTQYRSNGGFTFSGRSVAAGRTMPKMHSGAILNTFSELAKQPIQLEGISDHAQKRHSSASTKQKAVVTMIPLSFDGEQEFTMTENDSPLTTFLHSLDLTETVGLLHREKMDLNSLMLCSEEDLRSVGLALGPRKKILNAIETRKRLFEQEGQLNMTDTEI